MNKKLERFLIVFIDFVSINLAISSYFYFRVETGWFSLLTEPDFLLTMLALYVYWFIVFTFVGMYRTWFASSRFDELFTLFKATFYGIIFLFIAIYYDDVVHGVTSNNRLLIFIYWMLLLFSVGSGRLIIRSIQRNLLIKGIGRQKAVIVGFNPKANNIHKTIYKYKGLGIDITAYVDVDEQNIGAAFMDVKVIDTVKNIGDVIDQTKAHHVILALDKHEDDILFDVIDKCDNKNVTLKIVPDLYEIISGQARTSQIYGFPLIDIMPQLMPEWEKKVKRSLDMLVSFLLLTVTLPISLITVVLIKIDSPGPVFFKQERVGYKGKKFDVIKFRSMVKDAEKQSGPVWSTKNDPRITRVGRVIRKVRIDEIPQMINVLRGEMSLVGPRPEREYFVEQLSEEIPLYKRRLSVRPGITGWAQVKHKYDESIEDVKTKLRYDLFYIENMSLRMDMKILFRTIFIVLFGKGHYN